MLEDDPQPSPATAWWLARKATPMDLSGGVVALEVVGCSSEESPHAAKRLGSRDSVPVLRALLAGELTGDVGWRAEKFCEYPQEIVLRVGRSTRPRCAVDALVVVSHASLIARRIEIFLSSSQASDWRQARFERLGFITLQSPEETQCVAQELKTVPLPPGQGKDLTFIRLLLHTCHVHTANLFNQVALACVLAIEERPAGHEGDSDDDDTRSVADVIRRRVEQEKALAIEGPPSASPAWPAVVCRRKNPHQQRAPAPHAVWIADRNEYVTPAELLTRIQLARERHTVILGPTVHATALDVSLQFQSDQRLWAVDELECARLGERLAQLQDDEALARSVDDRLRVRRQIDALGECLRELDARVRFREGLLQRAVSDALATQLANSPVKDPRGGAGGYAGSPSKRSTIFRDADKWRTLQNWQAREEFLWRVVEAVKQCTPEETACLEVPDTAVLDEALRTATAGLQDTDCQVFIAAVALLTTVLQRHPRFQEGTAWKEEISTLLKHLVARLDDPQAPVRNNAAFALVKVAELTRAKGTFVVHTLLVHCERLAADAMTPQTLYGLLKVLTALLQGFHCCATLDVPAKRVLRFLIAYDALVHENGHVREAARQLLVVLQGEVGSEPVLSYLRNKKAQLTDDTLTEIEQLMAVLTGRKDTEPAASLDSTPGVL